MNINAYLSNEKSIHSSKLKQHLYDAGIKDKSCEICGLQTWLDKPLSLHLHHIDGDNKNNTLQNLQVLCPNCHSQTSNYSGKKKLKPKIKVTDEVVIDAIKSSYTKRQALLKVGLTGYGGSYTRINKVIEKYNVNFLPKPISDQDAKRIETINKLYGSMKELAEKRKNEEKIVWPEKQELKELLINNSCVKIAKKLGVSDGAVRKRAKKYGINLKEISPWSQKHGSK